MSARALASGTISFGLVSIPFKVYTAASTVSVSFHLLSKKTGHRLKQQYVDAVDKTVVERAEMVKGYEFSKDQYVPFTEDELKKLEAARTSSLELVEFVPEGSVDFVYQEKAYYLGPDKGGERAYQLLVKALERAGKVAVGRYWTHGKQQLVLLRPYRSKGLLLTYAYYAHEVHPFDEVELGPVATFKDLEMELADKLVEQLSVPAFEPKKYRDEYEERVVAAAKQKIAGQEIHVATEAAEAPIIDLFEALKRSLAGGDEKNEDDDSRATVRDAGGAHAHPGL
ncbi:MAG: Ku protein [Myxococcales bacterium]